MPLRRCTQVACASARLSAPGVGQLAGATSADDRRLLLQGLFLAPQMVGEALKVRGGAHARSLLLGALLT
eukprot:10408635-Ditylum_brightwellii.AAC.1